MSSPEVVPLNDWIAYLFDHEVTDPAWHFDIDAPYIHLPPAAAAELISETFEKSARLLRPFTDAQLNQGFWFLVSNGGSDHMFCLPDASVPLPLRQRALRSFVPLFEQLMAARCTPVLSHLDEPGTSPLNAACYMWWDILPLHAAPDGDPQNAGFTDDVFSVLGQLLAIPHDACRESALHGLGHWIFYDAKGVAIIDAFLAREQNLRPELVAYAKAARTGCIL